MRNDTPHPLSVLLVESGRTVGGTERVVWELATRLSPQRFAVRVWLSPSPDLDEFARALAARGLAVERVAEVDSRWDWKGMLGTWMRLRRLKPDLLHVHHVWPAADRYLAMLARAAGVKHCVITEHIVGRPHSDAQRALKRDELERADAITAVCGAVASTLVEDYGIGRDRVRVVPNGADPPDEAREAAPARAWRERFATSMIRPLWVVAARLEEQKGHAVLIDALGEVWKRGLDFTLAVAGEGSLRAALEERARAAGLETRVRFLGRIEDIGPLLAAADAVVLPSLWEGLPLTLLEAMARNRPVIATRVGGVPEAIEDGIHGALVPPSDVAALADELERFHRRSERATRLGRAAGERARREYSWAAVAAGFETVYDEVLGLATFSPAGSERAGRGSER
ncbi:MAG TPA: glycosyltransferase family 4 protein [Candidatus Acidoferrales bacterium]|nr:glycosyltransferase family 4 protein [Candidatus Acidoferrales bacterium]